MRLPRVRFTLRRMMATVAVVALLLYAPVLATRAARSRALAQQYQMQAALCAAVEQLHLEKAKVKEGQIADNLRFAANFERGSPLAGEDPSYTRAQSDLTTTYRKTAASLESELRSDREKLAKVSRARRTYEALAAKHLYAAAHPWLSVPPDRPAP